jgi:transposase InsO family protein/transposase-like protein
MGTFKIIPKETKEQILKRVKDDGISIKQVADEHGISTKTIRNWLRSTTLPTGNLLELNRLKRANKELLRLSANLRTHSNNQNKFNIRMTINQKPRESKTRLAHQLGIARSSLYYHPKRDVLDEEMKQQILIVQELHPGYGHKRIALAFGLNNKRIRRVMKKYGLKPYRRRGKNLRKKDDEGKGVTKWKNEISRWCPTKPHIVWASDFTYIKFQGTFLYLATIIDVYSREIVGWQISARHDTELVLKALVHAIQRTGVTPIYLHSDQGSEYDAGVYEQMAAQYNIRISMSHKSSPWENAFQESFYSHFKVDLGAVGRFEAVEELLEAIYQAIHYYNNDRIHSSLKMPPIVFKQQYEHRLFILRTSV